MARTMLPFDFFPYTNPSPIPKSNLSPVKGITSIYEPLAAPTDIIALFIWLI